MRFIFIKRKGLLVLLAFIISIYIGGQLDSKFPGFITAWWGMALIWLFAALINLLFTVLFTRKEVQISQDIMDELTAKRIAEHRIERPDFEPSPLRLRMIKLGLYLIYSRYSALFFIRNKYYTYIALAFCLLTAVEHLISVVIGSH